VARDHSIRDEKDDAEGLLHDPGAEIEHPENSKQQQAKEREQLIAKLHQRGGFNGRARGLAMIEYPRESVCDEQAGRCRFGPDVPLNCSPREPGRFGSPLRRSR
jgi:hypothetical protein